MITQKRFALPLIKYSEKIRNNKVIIIEMIYKNKRKKKFGFMPEREDPNPEEMQNYAIDLFFFKSIKGLYITALSITRISRKYEKKIDFKRICFYRENVPSRLKIRGEKEI